MGLIIVLVLLLLLLGGWGSHYGYNAYGPAWGVGGGLGTILIIIFVVWLLSGRM